MKTTRAYPPPIDFHISISLPYPEVSHSDSISIYFYSYGNFPNVYLALFYPIGKLHLPLVNFYPSMFSLMLQGSKANPYPRFQKELQRLGNSISHFLYPKVSGFNINSISLKGLAHAFKLLKEAIEEPEFNEELILSHKRNALQQLEVQMRDSSWQASRYFRHHLFGPNHPFGHQNLQDEIELIDSSHISEEWQQWIQYAPNQALIVSNFSRSDIEEVLKSHFGFQCTKVPEQNWPIVSQKGYFYIPVEGELTQASIRIGKILPGFSHPDYFPLRFVTIALGGFFGSRLMQKIREQEGLTYGINAQYKTTSELGYLILSAETSNPKLLIELVHEEIEKLHRSPFTQEEMERTKNYIKGAMLSLYDSPESIFSFLFSHLQSQKSLDHTEKWLQFSDRVTIDQLQEVIHAYFEWDSFLIIHAGKKS